MQIRSRTNLFFINVLWLALLLCTSDTISAQTNIQGAVTQNSSAQANTQIQPTQLLVLAPETLEQGQTVTITIRLTTAQGEPIQDAEIQASGNAIPLLQAYTDSSGDGFLHLPADLSPGNYNLKITFGGDRGLAAAIAVARFVVQAPPTGTAKSDIVLPSEAIAIPVETKTSAKMSSATSPEAIGATPDNKNAALLAADTTTPTSLWVESTVQINIANTPEAVAAALNNKNLVNQSENQPQETAVQVSIANRSSLDSNAVIAVSPGLFQGYLGGLGLGVLVLMSVVAGAYLRRGRMTPLASTAHMHPLQPSTKPLWEAWDYLQLIWRWLWLIMICALAAGGISYGVSTYAMTPIYQAATTLMVKTNATSAASAADKRLTDYDTFLANEYMTATFKALAEKRLSPQVVAQKLELPIAQTSGQIQIDLIPKTPLITLSFNSANPQVAQQMVNGVAVTFIQLAQEETWIPGRDLVIIKEATLPIVPISPRVLLNTLVAAMVGAVLTLIVIFFVEYMRFVTDDQPYIAP